MNPAKQNLHTNPWQLAVSYWFSLEAPLAWGLLLGAIILNLGIVFITLYLNNWQSNFYNQLQHYNFSGFFQALHDFSIMAAGYIILLGCQTFLQMVLEIRWRRWMTAQYLHNWLHNKTYYYMNMLSAGADNPDQRISEDIHLFVSNTLTLFLGLLKQLATLILFLFVLWQLSGIVSFSIGQTPITIHGYLVWAALGYSMLGTWLTAQVGRPLVTLNITQQRCEADFRYSLVRLRENDKSIAAYNGENYEKSNFMNDFHKIYGNYRKIITITKNLTWLTASYSQVSIVFTFLMASPRYFSNDIQLGQLFEISGAYWYVHSALSYIIDSFTKIAQWQSVLIRLSQFNQNMNKAQLLRNIEDASKIKYSVSNCFTLKNMYLQTPDKQTLLNNLSLELHAKDKLLIIGPSGCGKSTLLHTLIGIWPFFQGNIQIPSKQKLMLLPQKSYIPFNTLGDALLYPDTSISFSRKSMQETLAMCNLPFLVNQLDHRENWERILSLGEQQRLAIARAILHKPDWLLLDEGTSALDDGSGKHMYELLQQALPTTNLISVGHREILYKFHTMKLELDGLGTWKLSKL